MKLHRKLLRMLYALGIVAALKALMDYMMVPPIYRTKPVVMIFVIAACLFLGSFGWED